MSAEDLAFTEASLRRDIVAVWGAYGAHADVFDAMTKATTQLRHERDLLAKALGDLLVAQGVAAAVPMTGPELLALAEGLTERAGL